MKVGELSLDLKMMQYATYAALHGKYVRQNIGGSWTSFDDTKIQPDLNWAAKEITQIKQQEEKKKVK